MAASWGGLLPSPTCHQSEGHAATGGGFYTTSFPSCQTEVTTGLQLLKQFMISPSATYYLANPISNGDEKRCAVDDSAVVRVINMSLSTNWDGPGDGTSPYADSLLKAVDAAIAGGAIVTIPSATMERRLVRAVAGLKCRRVSRFGKWSDVPPGLLIEFISVEPVGRTPGVERP